MYEVFRVLGHRFLDKVYENALMVELQNSDLTARKQFPIKIYYKGAEVGDYFADILVED